MADNLTISITANTGQLRAELAVSQADVRALTRELNSLANVARRTGSELDMSRVAASAARLNEATAAVARLKAELSEGGGLFGRGINEGLQGLAQLSSRMRETAEVAGFAYAADKIREFVRESAEAGEKARNNAFALGVSVRAYAELSGAMRLAGGDAETAQRAIERLAAAVQQTLQNPNSQAAVSFRNLGVSMDEVRAHANDLIGMLGVLIERVGEDQPGLQRTAELHQLLGRGMDRLVPLFRHGAEGYRELLAAAGPYADVIAREAPALDADAEALNRLALNWQTLKAEMAPVVDFFVQGVDNMIGTLRAFIAMCEAAIGAAGRLWSVALHAPQASVLSEQLGDTQKQIAALEAADAHRRAGGYGQAGPWPNLGANALPPAGTESPELAALKARAADLRTAIDKEMAAAKIPVATPAAPPIPTEDQLPKGGRPVGTERPAKGSSSAADINSEYRLQIAEERAKGDTADETAKRIEAIYQEWLARLASIYGQDSQQYRQVAIEKLNFEREVQQRIFEQAKAGAEKQIAVLKSGLKEYEASQKTLAEAGTISPRQAAANDIAQVQKTYDAAQASLAALAPLATTADMRQQLAQAGDEIKQWGKTTTAELVAQWQEAAKKAADAWAQPFKTALDRIGSSIEGALKGLLTARTFQERQSAYRNLYRPLLSAGLDLGGSLLSKGSAALFGAQGGQGLGEFVSGKLLSALGLGSQAPQLALQTTANSFLATIAANTAVIAGTSTATAASSTANAGTSAISAAGSAGGIVSGISNAGGFFSSIGKFFAAPLSFLGLAKGGIVPAAAGGWVVPSAAGGWSLPSSFGSDRIMAALTPGEMVLPAGISQGLQSAIAGGGLGGDAGGDTYHLHFHGPADGPAIERFLRPLIERATPGALRNALRSNALTPRSI